MLLIRNQIVTAMYLEVNKNDHVQGPVNAPIELIEYADYQCPYCKKAYHIVKDIQKKLGDKVKFVFRNFPLTELHPHALHAAIAAEIAASHGKFWEMHDFLFENQNALDDYYLLEYARKLGINAAEFETDFGKDRFYQKVKDDYDSGLENDVQGTPTFFVNGEQFDGNWSGIPEPPAHNHLSCLQPIPGWEAPSGSPPRQRSCL